jgi:hypothetical protein
MQTAAHDNIPTHPPSTMRPQAANLKHLTFSALLACHALERRILSGHPRFEFPRCKFLRDTAFQTWQPGGPLQYMSQFLFVGCVKTAATA